MSSTAVDEDVLTKEETEIHFPELYRVILHNDDTTTFEFVVKVLIDIFDKSESEADTITNTVHNDGTALVAIYPFEIAEQKITETTELAKASGFILKVTMEED